MQVWIVQGIAPPHALTLNSWGTGRVRRLFFTALKTMVNWVCALFNKFPDLTFGDTAKQRESGIYENSRPQ